MKVLAVNKRARFDYDTVNTLEAGLMLLGTEVKSVKAGNISLKGSYVTFHGDEPYLTNATIPPWQPKNAPSDYEPTRPRKVLLKKQELKQLFGAKQASGLTIIPIRVYVKGARIKLEIALARGKRKYEKKERRKEEDIKRDVERLLAGRE